MQQKSQKDKENYSPIEARDKMGVLHDSESCQTPLEGAVQPGASPSTSTGRTGGSPILEKIYARPVKYKSAGKKKRR